MTTKKKLERIKREAAALKDGATRDELEVDRGIAVAITSAKFVAVAAVAAVLTAYIVRRSQAH